MSNDPGYRISSAYNMYSPSIHSNGILVAKRTEGAGLVIQDMSSESVFPIRPQLDVEEQEAKTVRLLSEEGIRIIEALGCDTARNILTEIRKKPAAKSDIAENLNLSLQTVKYHMDRLHEAGVIRVAGTHYSVNGKEMDIYTTDGHPLILVSEDGQCSHQVSDNSAQTEPVAIEN